MKSPAFQFYPGDWRRDLPLRCCSIAARGTWLELMNIMHEGTPYGHLATAQGPLHDTKVLARLLAMPHRQLLVCMAELLAAGVPGITREGVWYSRRMVRDEEIRERRRTGGLRGGHDHATGVAYGRLGGRPKGVTEGVSEGVPEGVTPEPPLPSSSASASSEPRTTLSGWRPTAIRCLEFLNDKTGRTYQPVRANLSLLEARLKEGATEANIRGVIARKVRQWQGDPKMAEFLRPKTLFNATNFAQYLGERAPEAGNGLPPVQ